MHFEEDSEWEKGDTHRLEDNIPASKSEEKQVNRSLGLALMTTQKEPNSEIWLSEVLAWSIWSWKREPEDSVR